jgi:uncharacterized protein (DUF302 family)
MSRTLDRPYDATVTDVRERLAEQGFGVLTEIDVRQTMKAKLDLDVAPQVILGACRPQLAHQAMTAVPSIAAMLPCNVVIRELPDGRTVVEMLDPDAMLSMVDDETLREVARDARQRLTAALAALTGDD